MGMLALVAPTNTQNNLTFYKKIHLLFELKYMHIPVKDVDLTNPRTSSFSRTSSKDILLLFINRLFVLFVFFLDSEFECPGEPPLPDPELDQLPLRFPIRFRAVSETKQFCDELSQVDDPAV